MYVLVVWFVGIATLIVLDHRSRKKENLTLKGDGDWIRLLVRPGNFKEANMADIGTPKDNAASLQAPQDFRQEIGLRGQGRRANERNEQQDLNQGMETGTHSSSHQGVNWGSSYRTRPRIEHTPLTREQIAARAHEFYLQRGAGGGRDVQDWLRAEEELKQEHAKANWGGLVSATSLSLCCGLTNLAVFSIFLLLLGCVTHRHRSGRVSSIGDRSREKSRRVSCPTSVPFARARSLRKARPSRGFGNLQLLGYLWVFASCDHELQAAMLATPLSWAVP
jgi:Protein of unknown function (DUF2934)